MIVERAGQPCPDPRGHCGYYFAIDMELNAQDNHVPIRVYEAQRYRADQHRLNAQDNHVPIRVCEINIG